MSFYSLHNHSAYGSNGRFLDSINIPDDMVKRSIELGYSGIAFTEHECLSSAVTVLKARDKIKEEHPDFKVIFGNEIYLIDESEVKNTTRYFHFILLAKDMEGWRQLRELSSRAWERGYMERGMMRVPTTYKDIEEVVGINKGHIIASSGCLGSEIDQCILTKDKERLNKFVVWCLRTFGRDNFYLEMQPATYEEQIEVNKTILKLSKFFNIPYIVTTDSHYLKKEDFSIHSAFLNSRQSGDRETDKFYKFTYLMSLDEMRILLREGGLTDEQIDTAFENTCKIGERIEQIDFRHSTFVPQIKLPEFKVGHLFKKFYTDEYPGLKYFSTTEDKQEQFLLYQIEEGFKLRGGIMTLEKVKRIDTELDIIHYISERLGQSLSAYFNLTVDMVNIAWAVSISGAGRGSACGEYINYLIGITQVDPLKYDLPYWRFLNKERAELPDIDVDYVPEKTDEIIDLLRQHYGEDCVLNCASFKTETLKSATQTACRGLGINNDEAQAIAAMVPQHRGKLYTLEQCENGDEEQGFEPVPGFIEKLKSYPKLYETVKMIEGLPTNITIHASALYIFSNGYLDHNSLMRAPNGTRITAFNMHDSDDMGALKMDVLRTDAQSKIQKCLFLLLKDGKIEWQGSLKATYDKYIHPDVIDYDDPKMWQKAWDGKIEQLFQFETMVGGVCIKRAKPENVRQLAEINSIMRLQSDGEEQPIDRYVRFHDNIEEWYKEMRDAGLNEHEIEILKKYLSKSYGVSSSQEVLMQILMDPEISGFTLGEANAARRAISKKKTKELIQLKKDFFEKGSKTPNAK